MLLVWALAFVALALAAILYQHTNAPAAESIARITMVQVGGATVKAEVADTLALQTRGLSGRTNLPEGGGMLFVFEEQGAHGIWMKDMLFAIDILWATGDGTIITVAERVAPGTYPQSFYASSAEARYVLEVPAGFVARAGIKEGMTLELE